MDSKNFPHKLDDVQKQLFESAILEQLKMSYEERFESHENARQLADDLKSAGDRAREKSESPSRTTFKA